MTVPASYPENERERLDELRRHELLDTEAEQGFDDLVRVAAELFSVPISLVSLVDTDRQWFKARCGLDAEQTPRDVAVCAHAILEPEQVFVVRDTTKDARFKNNPLVTGGLKMRFYAGAPLVTEGGFALGTLCILDTKPRDPSAGQIEALKLLARQTVGQMTLRLQGRELETAKRRAEEDARAKSDFLAMMSHEIRTPLNAVVGYAELLQLEALPSSAQAFAQQIADSGELLLGIVNDVLDLARLDSGHAQLVLAPVNVRSVALAARELLMEAAQQKGVTVAVDIDCDAWVLADQARLMQVFVNLVSNAIKFTSHGDVRLSSERLDGRVRCEIRDTGIGIEAHALGSLFDDFVQANPRVWQEYGGTGLGLPICRRLVNAMSGEISVVSEVGVGSRFCLELPSSPRGTAESQAPSQLTLSRGGHVLVVDDNAVNLKLAERMLQKLGFRVSVAASGPAALRACEGTAFDVIFMDCQMPFMDGYQATAELRARPKTQATKIVALTANASERDKERCFQAGMDDYLSKPLKLGALSTVVQSTRRQKLSRD